MILQRSSQNVNSNAGVFLAKQLLDRMGGFSRFDGWQKAARSVPCQRYSNSSLVKAQVALEVRGETGGVSRLRLRTVLLNYIYVGAICGSHGGRRYLRLGRNCHVADVFMAIGARLAA